MSRVLMRVGAAIVLAGIVFAVVHFSSRQGPVAFTAQKGWVPLSPNGNQGPAQVVGTFGAWRLLCRDFAPPGPNPQNPDASKSAESHRYCAVVLLMRNRGVAKEWINLRFQEALPEFGAIPMEGLSPMSPAGPPSKNPGALARLVFAQEDTPTPSTLPGAARKGVGVDLMADKHTFKLLMRRCVKGVCFAMNQFSTADLDSILSAHALMLRLPWTKKSKDVPLPKDGLKAALAAMKRQPA